MAALQAQVDCGPRIPNSPGAECARQQILTTVGGAGARAGVQRFTLADPYGGDSLRLQNVIASFYPERADRVLLLAHYDTRPRADRDAGPERDRPIPGANDGASGVAVLLEVAHALDGWDPGMGVDLLFTDGEDYGREGDLDYYLLGARHFVRTMGAYRPRAVLLVDMVGERGLRIPMEGNSARNAPALTQLVFDVAASVGARAFVREEGPAIFDDHVPFLQVGIPAVNLIDFDYPPWHTQADTPDRCAPESLFQVTQVLLHTVARLARD
jgi:Zn-dependent M28 family amino/carboxypeptidase